MIEIAFHRRRCEALPPLAMLAGPGTEHAPLTRVALVVLLLGGAALSLTGAGRLLVVESFPAQCVVGGQWWRPWTAQAAPSSLGHVLVASWLLWRLGRHLERVLGSQRARSFALSALLLPPLLLASLALLVGADVFAGVGGPVALGAAVAALALRLVPVSRVERVMLAAVAAQLVVPSLPNALWHAAAGCAVGALWPVQGWARLQS